MKIWYATPAGFTLYPRTKSSSGGVTNRLGLVGGLRALGHQVGLASYITRQTRDWATQQGVEWDEAGQAPAWTPDALVIEGFASSFPPSWLFGGSGRLGANLLTFYRMLEVFEGLVVYILKDQDYGPILDAAKISKLVQAPVSQKRLWANKRWIIASPGLHLDAVRQHCIEEGPGGMMRVPYTLAYLDLSDTVDFGQWFAPTATPACGLASLALYGKEDTSRWRQIHTLLHAARTHGGLEAWAWRMYGPWPKRDLGPIELHYRVEQVNMIPTLSQHAVVLSLYRDLQHELGWHSIRDYEGIQAGAAVLVADSSPLAHRPDFPPAGVYSSPEHFAQLLDELQDPGTRLEVADEQQAWLTARRREHGTALDLTTLIEGAI